MRKPQNFCFIKSNIFLRYLTMWLIYVYFGCVLSRYGCAKKNSAWNICTYNSVGMFFFVQNVQRTVTHMQLYKCLLVKFATPLDYIFEISYFDAAHFKVAFNFWYRLGNILQLREPYFTQFWYLSPQADNC